MDTKCEGATEYQEHGPTQYYDLINLDGERDTSAWLCEHCVADDIKRGYDWKYSRSDSTLDRQPGEERALQGRSTGNR